MLLGTEQHPEAPSYTPLRRPLTGPETMGTWRAETKVQARPEQVLETLTDVDACEAWSPVDFAVDGLQSRRLRVGARVAVSGAIVGRRVRFWVEIVHADRERFALHAVGPVDMLADYVVRPAADGTHVLATISVRRGKGVIGRIAAHAIAILLGAGVFSQTLARIAREAERRHGPTTTAPDKKFTPCPESAAA